MSPGHRKAGRATTRSSRTETTSSSSVALLDPAAQAKVAHHASRAVRPAGVAGAAAMPDQELVRPSPEPVRQQGRQLPFHLARVLLAREPQPPRDPADVGVHGQRGRAESVVHHHPRRLPADSGQLAELLTLSRKVSAVIARDPRHRLVQVLRFRPPEPDAPDLLAEDLRRAAGVVRRGRVPREERRRHLVYDRVGGLGGEHHRDQQLQLVFVVQSDLRLGHLFFQQADDLREPARAVCFRFAGHRGRVYHGRARGSGNHPAGKAHGAEHPMDLIDLRSHAVTRPTAGMRKAMAAAEVGDDVYGEDPTINALQDRVAALLGKEAAVWVPTGTMANQIALGSLAGMGDEIICDRSSHVVNYEGGAISALWGAQSLVVDGPRGIFTAEAGGAVLRSGQTDHDPRQRAVAIENTHNRGGGSIWPLAQMEAVADVPHRGRLAVHPGRARVLNAPGPARVAARAPWAQAGTGSGL